MAHEPTPYRIDDAGLESLLAEARDTPPMPSDELMARVIADAAAQTAARSLPTQTRHVERTWLDRLGGLLDVVALPTGVGLAGVVGLWIGASYAGTGALDFSPMYDTDLGLSLVYYFPGLSGLLPGS